MAQLQPQDRPRNALSNSPSGDSYTGLGCFPLGHHTTPTETADLIKALRALREHKLLQRIPPSAYDAVKAHLAPLKQAQVFWAHHARDAPVAHAVHELLDLLDGKSDALNIYIFPDSTLLRAAAPVVWGLSERETHAGTTRTHLYISGKQEDLAGAVMHVFLSSRGISRLQCFLAEYVLADQAERLTEDWELPGRVQGDFAVLTREEVGVLRGRLDEEGKIEAPVLLAKLAGVCEEVLGEEKVEEGN